MRKITLGLMVLVGLVFAEEQNELIKDLDKKCKNGDMKTCAGLGDVYFIGMYGLDIDYQKAKFYFEKVCRKGKNVKKDEAFLEACANLGMMYHREWGVQQNHKKALELYTLACNGGHAKACTKIGTMYYQGDGVLRDLTKGIAYFKKACDVGDWMGCGIFATYHNGLGDRNKAVQYFKKACELGRNDDEVWTVPSKKEAWQNICNSY